MERKLVALKVDGSASIQAESKLKAVMKMKKFWVLHGDFPVFTEEGENRKVGRQVVRTVYDRKPGI